MAHPLRAPGPRAPLLALLVLAAARLPGLEDVGVLAVLRGPLGLVLAVLAVLVAVAPLGAPAGTRLFGRAARAPSGVLFGAAIVVLLPVALYYTSRLRVSGDEPHYLVMAQSLWRDHDLDLPNNYEGGDWREYTPGPVAPHYGAPRSDGRPFPAHSPGLPFILAPAYAAGGRTACVVLLVLAAAATSVLVRALALRVSGDPGAAFLAFLAALGPPAFFYAFHVYTEAPSALAVAGSLVLLLGSPGPGGALVASLLASSLPWLHVKMIPAAIALGVVALVRLRTQPRLVFVAAAAAMAALFLAYYQSVLGHPTPLALYAGLPAEARMSPLPALFGLALDRSFGLLPHAPVFLLALAGLGAFLRRRSEAWPHLLVGASILGSVLTWRMWWGGQCPPARFLVPLVPVLAVALAARVAEDARGIVRWRFALLGAGWALALFMVAEPGRLLLLNRGNRPTRVWDALSGAGQIGRYLPSLTDVDAAEIRVTMVWVGALLVLFVLDGLAEDDDRMDRLFRGLGLPIVLLMAVGLAVDLWARRPARTEEPTRRAQGPGEPRRPDSVLTSGRVIIPGVGAKARYTWPI
jgi:hypothetical protein